MKKIFFEQKKHSTLIIILIATAYFFLMFGNGIISLTHPDEVFYIQSAKEMIAYNSWLTPIIFDDIQFEKPFLAFSLFALAIKWFGLTSFVARFWPAFFGMLGVCVTYWMAWMLFRRKRQAFLSGLIICTSFIYLALSRAILTDMIFSVLVLISIGFFYFAYSNRRFKNTGIILCFVFSAVAVLTKGILGFTFPAATVLIFLFYKKDLFFLRSMPVFAGGILFFVIVLPWHLLMYQSHGQFFLDEYFWNVHVRRIFDAEHAKLDNWYFYIGLMFAGVMPWSFFWFPAIKSAVGHFRKKTGQRDKLFFLFSWITGVYIFVQPAHSKLASYIFPVFPAIAIFLAQYLDQGLDKCKKKEVVVSFRICGYAMSVFLAGAAVAAIIYGKNHMDIIVNMNPLYIFFVMLVVVSGLIFIFNQRRQYAKMIFSYAGVTVTLLVTMFLAKPYIEPWVSCMGVSDALNKIDQSSTTVLASKFYVRGVRFYTDRKMAVIDINGSGFFSPHPIPFLNTDEKIIDFLASQHETYAVVKDGDVDDLHRIIKGRFYSIEELFGAGGKYLLRIKRIKKHPLYLPQWES